LGELERRFRHTPGARDYLRALSASRFGARGAGPTPAQRRALRAALASGLGVRGLVRAWWALPPRPATQRLWHRFGAHRPARKMDA